MEELKDKAGTLTDHIGDYIEIYLKLIGLNATDKATGIVSATILSITVAILGLFVLFFASLGAGWWIGEQLDSMLGGFSIVAGFYGLTIAIVLLLRKKIVPSIQNTLIKKVYEDKDNLTPGSDTAEAGIAKAA
jgi:hypothetical protein